MRCRSYQVTVEVGVERVFCLLVEDDEKGVGERVESLGGTDLGAYILRFYNMAPLDHSPFSHASTQPSDNPSWPEPGPLSCTISPGGA